MSKPSPALPSNSVIGLAIEVIGRSGSVAFIESNFDATLVLAETFLPAKIRATASLTPAIESILRTQRRVGRDLDYIAVATGPGSFTGLRIAVTTAKTLAYAWGLPVIPVDSMSAIAAATNSDSDSRFDRMLVGLAAYRGQTFTAWLDRCGKGWRRNGAIECLDQEAWAERRRFDEHQFLVAGDPASFGDQVESDRWAPARLSLAAGVGRLAAKQFADGETMSPIDLVPNYFRLSAAEENA